MRFFSHLITLGMTAALSLSYAHASDFIILPVVGSQPDTGLQLGVATFWESSPEPDSLAASLFFVGTASNQQALALGLRTPGLIEGTQDAFDFGLRISRFPNEFYGYRAKYIEDGEKYEDMSLELRGGWSYPLSERWRVGGALVAAWADIEFEQPNSPDLQSAAWTEGGQVQAVELSLTRDTRDELSWPTRGTFVDTTMALGRSDDAGAYYIASQSGAAYWQSPYRVIFALGGQVQQASADTPFPYMPTLNGSQWMRGAVDGQYRHRSTVTTQLEARIPITRRFASSVFVHAGQVGESPSEWQDTDLKTGFGTGLRYSISDERRLNIRIDMGWVDGRRGLVINFGEAF
ncbi:MAG: BamA/TamA family outer membrane protein [Natronospirillum sp.]